MGVIRVHEGGEWATFHPGCDIPRQLADACGVGELPDDYRECDRCNGTGVEPKEELGAALGGEDG